MLFDRGWDEPFTGEVVGLIEGAVFVRFGDVFQGLLPAGRLGGGERCELDRLGCLPGRADDRRRGCGSATSCACASARSTVRAAASC